MFFGLSVNLRNFFIEIITVIHTVYLSKLIPKWALVNGTIHKSLPKLNFR